MHHPILATVITLSLKACTNKAFCSKSTRFNPYFGWYKIYMQNTPLEVEIKSCKYATECFICTYIWLRVSSQYRMVHRYFL